MVLSHMPHAVSAGFGDPNLGQVVLGMLDAQTFGYAAHRVDLALESRVNHSGRRSAAAVRRTFVPCWLIVAWWEPRRAAEYGEVPGRSTVVTHLERQARPGTDLACTPAMPVPTSTARPSSRTVCGTAPGSRLVSASDHRKRIGERDTQPPSTVVGQLSRQRPGSCGEAPVTGGHAAVALGHGAHEPPLGLSWRHRCHRGHSRSEHHVHRQPSAHRGTPTSFTSGSKPYATAAPWPRGWPIAFNPFRRYGRCAMEPSWEP